MAIEESALGALVGSPSVSEGNSDSTDPWRRNLPSLTVGLLTLDPMKALENVLSGEPQNNRTSVRTRRR